ncbi:tellurite resistance TerB family protein [Mesorhizobium xinjiangense]|uniref:tellurite resistance TerB family protein n=1 Tax=Mesorhizobium xinjiangense TaxID=2678685 RepID=UPI0012ED0C6B|nr:TerB family tellurite resistance protein [Mesorhizobium xinjiangense]
MFDRLIDFLRDLPGAGSGRDGEADEDPRVAAAALMFHVMDADGVRLDVERERLEAALSEAYGISGKDLSALVAKAEKADREAIDLYAFTSVLKRHLDEQGRFEFIRIMWEIVFADGELSELEDNVVWRVAELIGVERPERIALRQQAQEASGVAPGSGDGD